MSIKTNDQPNDLAARLAAVEQACGSYSLALTVGETSRSTREVVGSACALSDALRAAREQGMRPAMVSREAVEALREWRQIDGNAGHAVGACSLLARDLAPLIKEGKSEG